MYIVKDNNLAKKLITFGIGGFGGMVFFLLIFKNVQAVGKIAQPTVFFYLFLFLFSTYGLIIRYTMTYIITNKRIHAIFPTKISVSRAIDCKIEDIETLELQGCAGLEVLKIKLKNGNYFEGLGNLGSLKEAKEIIENIKKDNQLNR